jgi:hypothetical protein
MNEQTDANANDVEGWPLPSTDVLRELEPPAVTWSESEPVSNRPSRPTARG